jgi:protein TonB
MKKVLIAVVMLSAIGCFGMQALPTPSTPTQYRVSSGVMQGLLLHTVTPAYPEAVKKNHIKGDVMLTITVDPQGHVANAKLLKGDPALADAAIEAVKQWIYKPYLLNGEPIEVEAVVLVRFKK